ncbi:MAG: hypothetical protein IMW95_01085 [Moorella humiferrea]|nr:hypothetical protein [Moorella humiferrea]
MGNGTIPIRQELVWTKNRPPAGAIAGTRMVGATTAQNENAEGNYKPSAPVFCTTNGNYIIPSRAKISK